MLNAFSNGSGPFGVSLVKTAIHQPLPLLCVLLIHKQKLSIAISCIKWNDYKHISLVT